MSLSPAWKILRIFRIDQDVAEKGEVQARRQRIDQPCPLFRLDLEEAELLPEVAEGVVLGIERDDRRGADRLFGLGEFCGRIDEGPAVFHRIILFPLSPDGSLFSFSSTAPAPRGMADSPRLGLLSISLPPGKGKGDISLPSGL